MVATYLTNLRPFDREVRDARLAQPRRSKTTRNVLLRYPAYCAQYIETGMPERQVADPDAAFESQPPLNVTFTEIRP